MVRTNKNQKLKILHKNREKGQAFVFIGLSLIILIAAAGLATDATLLYKTKQDLQRTIDSAALAAAYKLPSHTNAEKAAYEFARLHGYDFDPSGSHTLTIGYPVYDPPRKAVTVAGSTTVHFAFLSILGFHTMEVKAQGEAESAPLDVYLIFDMSQSMVYDTPKPSPWPPAGSPCSTWDSSGMYDCVAKYCNWARKCDPLDIHIKPAAKYFIDQLDPQFDRVGIVVYHQYGVQVLPLSSNFTAVKTAIDNINAFDHQGGAASLCPNTNPAGCNKNTNTGDGIMIAHNSIAGEGRMDAIWSMVLMTDGRANVYRSCTGCPPSCGAAACQTLYLCDECANADTWAINNAKDTWNRHETVIYTIAYGDIFFTDPSYRNLMIKIADWTDNGTLDGTTDNFWAVPDQAGLQTAFKEIAERIYSRLLR
jgi:Putative Flp pilus-assembly TadE/G-like